VGEIVVPETDDAKTLGFEPTGPPFVSYSVLVSIVQRAVKLDDQPRSHAGEICDIGPDRNLPAEMRTLCLQGAEMLPQQYFGGCCAGAKAASAGAAKAIYREAVACHC